ncbi:glycosyltransferase [Naumannella sp. ID2617S]|nr:glycosyltransferase [Naumannella sp. ID2617S]
MRRLRIAVIGPYRYPLRQPVPGGLEGHVMDQVRLLRGRGHEVLLVAPRGSEQLDPRHPELAFEPLRWPEDADPSDDRLPPGALVAQEQAYATAMHALARIRPAVDVVHNHSLSGAPLRLAARLGLPMLTTLHTPVLTEMLSGLREAGTRAGQQFVAVSEHTRRGWAQAGVPAEVLLNGVDTSVWRPGPGGPGLFWFGRVVPEKAPHLAVLAARRAGLPLRLAGRVGAPRYFREVLAPLLDDRAHYLGECSTDELAELVGSSGCVLVTPGWDEPFGLVLPESLSCGTPVAAFARGGLIETGAGTPAVRLVRPDDLPGLAAAAVDLVGRPELRDVARAVAEAQFSVGARIGWLERAYLRLANQRVTRQWTRPAVQAPA